MKKNVCCQKSDELVWKTDDLKRFLYLSLSLCYQLPDKGPSNMTIMKLYMLHETNLSYNFLRNSCTHFQQCFLKSVSQNKTELGYDVAF